MRKSVLALTVLATLGGAGCATNSDDQPPGGDGGGDDAPPFTDGVSTLSGGAEAGYADGRRGQARFANPVNVAVGPNGMIYVADFDNGKIRAVDAEGTTSTVVAITSFERPFAMAFAGDGALYVTTDRDPKGVHGPMTGTIWRVDVSARTATPVAVGIGRPRGLAVLPDGTLAASDYTHHVIQRINPTTGAVTPIAGAWDQKGLADGIGAAARFSTPYGLVFVGGALVVADHDNHRLRRVTLDGNVSSFAGSGVAGYGDGSLATAKLNKPQGLAAAANGDLYVSDLDNFRIRRIRGDMVETIAGNGRAGYLDSDDRLEAQLYGLEGVAVKPDGSMVYVADGSRGENVLYHRVRSIKMD
jgi:sugar lactone lactonase YvrE